jgi:hypothetical protein
MDPRAPRQPPKVVPCAQLSHSGCLVMARVTFIRDIRPPLPDRPWWRVLVKSTGGMVGHWYEAMLPPEQLRERLEAYTPVVWPG